MMQKFWTACQRIAHEDQLADCQEWSNSAAAMRELSQCAEALRHGLMDDRRLRLREACLALVQIYASSRPPAERRAARRGLAKARKTVEPSPGAGRAAVA